MAAKVLSKSEDSNKAGEEGRICGAAKSAVCLFLLFGLMCLAQTGIFCFMYWDLWNEVSDIGEETYDTCGDPSLDT